MCLLIMAPVKSLARLAGSAGSAGALCSPPFTITGLPVDHLARAVAPAGDVDGDGFTDVILGGRGLVAGAHITDEGRARIYSGRTDELLYEFIGKPRTSLYDYSESLGWSVDGVGDINGDGYDDVIVGCPDFFLGHWSYEPGQFVGRAIVFSGFDGDTLYVFHGEGPYHEFGISVAGAGDVNADGVPDVIIGAWQFDNAGPAATTNGKAYVFSGLDGDTLHVFDGRVLPGPGYGHLLGCSVDGAGDVNGDGYDDLLIGAVDAGEDRSGLACIFSGFDGTLLRICDEEIPYGLFGHSVSGAGDVDRDGVPDVIVGAPYHNAAGDHSGSAYVYSGATGALIWALAGENAFDLFGWSVSGAGDMNGDGYSDLLVGVPTLDAAGPNSGGAYAFSGRDKSRLFTLIGEQAHDLYGSAVAGLGDLNNDGTPEIGICAMAYDGRFSDMGRSYVYSLCAQEIDILPGVCPNLLDINRGDRRLYEPIAARASAPTVSVAIRGTPYFVVSDVDTATILFAGVAPVRHRYAHVSTTPFQNETHCGCSIDTADGQIDLVVDFNRDELIAALGEASAGGDRQQVTLTAHLRGGGLIVGSDCLEVIPYRGLPASAEPAEQIVTTALRSNTPNPFNASTVIAFTLGESGPVRLEVFDILGRHVVTLADDFLPAGEHLVTWDGSNSSGNPAASGIYFYRLTFRSGVATRKMVLLK